MGAKEKHLCPKIAVMSTFGWFHHCITMNGGPDFETFGTEAKTNFDC